MPLLLQLTKLDLQLAQLLSRARAVKVVLTVEVLVEPEAGRGGRAQRARDSTLCTTARDVLGRGDTCTRRVWLR